MNLRPGEIVFADTAYGRRPAIVVSREPLNRGDTVVVVFCTTAKLSTRSSLPNCVAFQSGEFGLTKVCVAQCETIQMIEKQYLAPQSIGMLDDQKLREVIRAAGSVMNSECEPA
ncbi:MAG: type II toxin-antitoxin system PemK/MazF family toxin [Planctomycetaceae bacterium]|nr:type II toxin-antitoxin system PemK/MazF family toxin [Planctomycetaceae bacterium]